PFGGDVDAVVVGRQAQVDEGMAGAEGGKARQQPADREGPHRADGQHLPTAAALEAFERIGDPVKRALQHRQERFAFARQHQPARQPREERYVELGLKALDLMADGRLGDAQLDGGLREAQMARGGLEGAQGIQRHVAADHRSPKFSNASVEISSFAGGGQKIVVQLSSVCVAGFTPDDGDRKAQPAGDSFMAKNYVLPLSLLCASLCFTSIELRAEEVDSDRLKSIVDAAIRPVMKEYAVPGMAVGLTVDGKHYFFNYGVASQESGQ